jgi:hypothetical protein
VAFLESTSVTVEAMKGHLRRHVGCDGYTVCMHVEGLEVTNASMVVELPAAGRPVARCLQGSPCASVYVPLFVGRDIGDPVSWERFVSMPADRGINALVPELRLLEDELERDKSDDDAWPYDAWRRVDKVLAGLGR